MSRCFRPALALLVLAGCTAGPDYHLPETAAIRRPSAIAPFHSGQERAFAQTPLPDHWWRLYRDPQLDAAIAEALAANTDLRQAEANIRRAGALARQAEAGRRVQTSLTSGAYAARVGGYTETIPLGIPFSYLIGASVTYPLDLAGGLRRGIEATQADEEAAAAARDQVRVAVAAAVTRQYAGICTANLSIAAVTGVLAIEERTLAAMRRLFAAGRGTSFDVTRARAAADRSRAQIPTLLATKQGALYALAALMGRPPADYPRALETCAAPPEITSALPIGDGAALLRRRPDVREAERRLAAATARIGVETAQLYPQVSLGGSLGFANAIQAFGSASGFGATAGPLVSWSFPNRAPVRARIAAAGAAADAAAARFDGAVLEALRQTETALSAYAREIDRDGALGQARVDAGRAAEQAGKLFRFGRTDVLTVLTAQANLAEAEATLAASRAQLVDAQVQVFLALGGGWEGATDAARPRD